MPSEALAGELSLNEIKEVISHWDVGVVDAVTPMQGGSRQSPKARIVTNQGVFVLKRRSVKSIDLERVRFAHHVMLSLGIAGLPIALPQFARDHTTYFLNSQSIFELFIFINGNRWQRLPSQAFESGKTLAQLHQVALMMTWHGHVNASCFHGNLAVVEALRRAPAAIQRANQGQSNGVENVCEQISALYQDASRRVEDLEFQALDSQVVHGDWHAGNVLFDGDRISGILDFDSARLEPAIVDIANGLLQYAARPGSKRNVPQWPHELDEKMFSSFARGFASVESHYVMKFLNMVPLLMIEACIAEAAIPISRTGMFSTIPGEHILEFVLRRSTWIRNHSQELVRQLAAEITP